jgi:DNA invertase Pin-like site-specific DNA recombinase
MPRKHHVIDAHIRCAIYSRVSTDAQTTENQERELREIARRMGWTIVKVYKDEGIGGAKGRDGRPAFDALCKDATRRCFDMVMAWSVDRLGRSLQNLVTFLSELHALGIDLFLHQQGVDTTTPAGKALFQMMGVFAEFERAMIRERVKSGLERAKAQGKNWDAGLSMLTRKLRSGPTWWQAPPGSSSSRRCTEWGWGRCSGSRRP